MSDDEADPELLELLRKSLGLGPKPANLPPETKVLENARYVFDNSIDVALHMQKTKEAAETIWRLMQEKKYSTQTWSEHELHPKTKDESTVDFIFTMDLLNFSFWDDEADESKRYAVEYRGRRWTGYWSLVAALQRALEEDIPITNPDYWLNEDECTDDVLRHVFRSATDQPIPLLEERLECLREAGRVLDEKFDGSFINCIDDANGSAAALVNLLAEEFSCFRDESSLEGRRVRFYKRAQILVADLWACFNGESYGEFYDIEKITMFADYRIPQMLHQLGCMLYSPPLESHIRQLKPIPSGSTWEVEIRGTSIWCVELIRQQILRQHPEAAKAMFEDHHSTTEQMYPEKTTENQTNGFNSRQITEVEAQDANGNTCHSVEKAIDQQPDTEPANGHTDTEEPAVSSSPPTKTSVEELETETEGDSLETDDHNAITANHSHRNEPKCGINAILIDFFLYDTIKQIEDGGQESIPHHRTRSIWY